MTNSSLYKLDLKKILSIAQLPALPQSAIRLLELSQDTANGPAEFAVPIEADPGLAGQVLRFVNSSYFGFAREISSVKMAISLVGVRTIKNFALWSAVFSLTPNPRCGPFDLKSLWQDSLRRGLFARNLARLMEMKEPEDVFAAALLQDMAVPILAKEAPQVYIKLLEARDQGQVRLSALEEGLFGWTHAQAAGHMAQYWNLPDEFADLIASHPAIDQFAIQGKQEPAKAIVAMSALLPTVADSVWFECGQFESCYEIIITRSGIAVVELLNEVDKEFAELAPMLKIASPRKSLVDSYHEAVALMT
jgi:HD-like signal output (HDOD) protein